MAENEFVPPDREVVEHYEDPDNPNSPFISRHWKDQEHLCDICSRGGSGGGTTTHQDAQQQPQPQPETGSEGAGADAHHDESTADHLQP